MNCGNCQGLQCWSSIPSRPISNSFPHEWKYDFIICEIIIDSSDIQSCSQHSCNTLSDCRKQCCLQCHVRFSCLIHCCLQKMIMLNIFRGGALFLEDGVEVGNAIRGNLVVFVRSSSSLLNEDVTPAAIWVSQYEYQKFGSFKMH